MTDWRIHDLRRTVATNMRELGPSVRGPSRKRVLRAGVDFIRDAFATRCYGRSSVIRPTTSGFRMDTGKAEITRLLSQDELTKSDVVNLMSQLRNCLETEGLKKRYPYLTM